MHSWVTKQKYAAAVRQYVSPSVNKNRWVLSYYVKACFQGFVLSTDLLIQDNTRSLLHCWCQNCDSKVCSLQKCKAVAPVPETVKPFNSSEAGHSRNGVIQSCILKYKVKLFGLVFFNTFVAKLGLHLDRWCQVAYPKTYARGHLQHLPGALGHNQTRGSAKTSAGFVPPTPGFWHRTVNSFAITEFSQVGSFFSVDTNRHNVTHAHNRHRKMLMLLNIKE